LETPDHYATLGLPRKCSAEQIRVAYRLLAKQHHPDINPDAPDAHERAQAINAAYETLSDPARRKEYDRELSSRERPQPADSPKRGRSSFSQDVLLRLEDFFRGASLQVRVNDPANPAGAETYPLEVPPDTAPGTRFRVPRGETMGGTVIIRVKAQPSARFRPRASDVRTDLRINFDLAQRGGSERIAGPNGRMLSVTIPAHVERGAILKIRGEGLPKSSGGRGDLLVRITYRPEIRVTRK